MGQHPSGGAVAGILFPLGTQVLKGAQIGKPYRLFSHIFRPEFMKYN